MKDFFEELFIYNHMVNEKIIDCMLVNKEKLQPRTMKLISHVLLVHGSWNKRMSGMEGVSQLWNELDVNEVSAVNKANFAGSMGIIETNDLENIFEYRNTKGAVFANSFRDVLFHIINHSSYHRGQVNADLRKAGIEPVITEYIFYKR